MGKYRKKPVVIEAVEWLAHGDHKAVLPNPKMMLSEEDLMHEGGCIHCGTPPAAHGWVKTLEGGHIVCPGDWIITGVEGEHYPCKPAIFRKTYEAVE